jgi:hypothetical protein
MGFALVSEVTDTSHGFIDRDDFLVAFTLVPPSPKNVRRLSPVGDAEGDTSQDERHDRGLRFSAWENALPKLMDADAEQQDAEEDTKDGDGEAFHAFLDLLRRCSSCLMRMRSASRS